jgi:hypothetical protein
MGPWSRRRFLALAAAATMGAVGGGCGIMGRSRPVGPGDREVAAAEARRRRPGAPRREVTLTAAAATRALTRRERGLLCTSGLRVLCSNAYAIACTRLKFS